MARFVYDSDLKKGLSWGQSVVASLLLRLERLVAEGSWFECPDAELLASLPVTHRVLQSLLTQLVQRNCIRMTRKGKPPKRWLKLLHANLKQVNKPKSRQNGSPANA